MVDIVCNVGLYVCNVNQVNAIFPRLFMIFMFYFYSQFNNIMAVIGKNSKAAEDVFAVANLFPALKIVAPPLAMPSLIFYDKRLTVHSVSIKTPTFSISLRKIIRFAQKFQKMQPSKSRFQLCKNYRIAE